MAIKVHGFLFSPAVQRVLICLAEKGLDYELVNVDLLTGQQKKEPFILLNGTPLLVQDPKKLAILGVWSEVEAHRFDAAGQKLNYEILVKPFKGLTTDEALVEQLEAQLATVLDVYEKRLTESKYLAGEDFTLVDLHHVPIINYLMNTKVKALFEARPNVNAWCSELLSRPASQKVYGIGPSPPVQRVLACLNEKELDYELVQIDMKAGEHKGKTFLALNPFGQIPAFEHDDLKLFESRAINNYIAFAHIEKGTPLVFTEPKKMAIVSLGLEVEAHQFDPPASQLVRELLVKPHLLGLATDEAVVTEQEAKLAKVLDVYEARLAEYKYLCGDAFTLADLSHLPALEYLMGTRVKPIIEARAHVHAWAKDILARPAWQKVVAMKNNP
ncbi:glutathione S-transferase [Striga asiatica]|uniref:glutathione transferase n=1 Tax=Striga asiatica TaxID=4170 RepID=A0A5A7NW62_STRAF|nr:glutathione S-transferase [Striga asiatica]